MFSTSIQSVPDLWYFFIKSVCLRAIVSLLSWISSPNWSQPVAFLVFFKNRSKRDTICSNDCKLSPLRVRQVHVLLCFTIVLLGLAVLLPVANPLEPQKFALSQHLNSVFSFRAGKCIAPGYLCLLEVGSKKPSDVNLVICDSISRPNSFNLKVAFLPFLNGNRKSSKDEV